MPTKSKPDKQKEKLERAERLLQTINILEENVRQIKELGKLAPDGCYVSRYQARGQKKAYWYYKLHASTPIFPKVNSPTELSRYLHLGAAGSSAHVDAVKW